MAGLLKVLTMDLLCPLLLGLHSVPNHLGPSSLWKSLWCLGTPACTTRLELTLKRPGSDTIPMDIVPTGISQSTSTSSGVLKQMTTLVKPRGSVGGLTNASVLASGGDFGGNGAFGGLDGGLMEVVQVSWRALLFAFEAVVGWGISLVATTGQDGCTTVSHPEYFGATFGMGGASGVSVAPAGAEGLLPSSLGRSIPPKTSSSMKER